MEKIYKLISELAQKYAAEKLVLFGSRARGDNHERSDIDLAVYGMPDNNQAMFWWDLEDLPTLLKFDIVHIDENTDKNLTESIKKEGVTLYEKD